jgi:uncharacterized protein YecT (DUF1311 family)
MTGHERGGRSYLTIGVLLPPNLERVRIESHFMTKLSGAKKRLIIAYAVLGTCVFILKGESSEIETLINQDKQITEANNDLDGIYQKILTVLGSRINAGDVDAKQLRNALVEAERAWIQWRDAEALLRAYGGGSVGGSALREDLHKNLLALIDERKESLQELLTSIQQ